jgi:arsenate reductase-like glutaredoxin family protein
VVEVDAKKATITRQRALEVLEGVDELYATKGKKVIRVDLKREKPDRATLESLLVGPSGNLRAPTLRRGRTLLVGFDEATYAKVLG